MVRQGRSLGGVTPPLKFAKKRDRAKIDSWSITGKFRAKFNFLRLVTYHKISSGYLCIFNLCSRAEDWGTLTWTPPIKMD